MVNGIKIKLNYIQWRVLNLLISKIVELCPIENFELESYVMVELYRRLILKLTVWEPGNDKKMTFALRHSEAHAIHNFWSIHSRWYNINLRALIEPKLVPGNRCVDGFEITCSAIDDGNALFTFDFNEDEQHAETTTDQ